MTKNHVLLLLLLIGSLALGFLARQISRRSDTQILKERNGYRDELARLRQQMEASTADDKDVADDFERSRVDEGELQALRLQLEKAAIRIRELERLLPDQGPVEPRRLELVRADIREAFSSKAGARLLDLLAEMSSFGPEALDELLGYWAEAAADGSLGLAQLDLKAAMIGQLDVVTAALAGEHPVMLRHLAASALLDASMTIQDQVLKSLDLSKEKDLRIVRDLVPLMQEAEDNAYLPQFATLLNREDLSNNFRQSIAASVAQLAATEGEFAFEALIAQAAKQSEIQYVMPALQLLRDPPVDAGLVVINGPKESRSEVALADVVLEYNGRPISSLNDLWMEASKTRDGDRVPVKVWRNGVEETIFIAGSTMSSGFRTALASRAIHSNRD